MYIYFVRPLLEYRDSVWDNAPVDSKKQLSVVHTEATRITTSITKLCSIETLLSDLGWESLQKRQNKYKLIIFYKIINGLEPYYLLDLVPPIIKEIINYNLRNADDIQTLHARTNLYYKSFFPSTIRRRIACPKIQSNPHPFLSSNSDLIEISTNPPKYYKQAHAWVISSILVFDLSEAH